jgi:amino acid adenylation domain-containing protein
MKNATVINASECANLFWVDAKKLNQNEQYYYHFHCVYHYTNHLDPLKLTTALQKVVDQEYHLRSNFVYDEAESCLKHVIHHQVIANIISYQAQTETLAKEYQDREIHKPFNLEQDPLYRFVIIENKFDQTISLLVVIHHIVLDGTQYDALMTQIETFYHEPTQLPACDKPGIEQLQAYLQWEQAKPKNISPQAIAARLQQIPLQIELPKNDHLESTENAVIVKNLLVKDELYQKVKKYSKDNQHSAFNIIKAAFAVLLGKYARQEELLLAYPLNMRKDGFKPLKGCYVNTLYSAYNLKQISFHELLSKEKEQIAASKHSREFMITPLQLREFLDISKITVSVSQISTRYKMPLLDIHNIKGAVIYPIAASNIILYIDDNGEDLFLQLLVKPGMLSDELTEKFMDHFSRCLANLLTQENTMPVSQATYLSVKEYQTIVDDFNHTRKIYSKRKTLHQLFEEQVEKTPKNKAVIYDNVILTYEELNQKANQLARVIRKEYQKITGFSLVSDALIPLCMERSADLLIAVLAILKAGGAYVPIDPNAPKNRIDYMLRDLQAPFVLTHASTVSNSVLQEHPIKKIEIVHEFYAQEKKDNLNYPAHAKDLAYVIYTSGTTGEPKGVMLQHEGVVNRIEWMQNQYGLQADDRILQKTPYFFDVSVWELFWANWFGGAIVFCEPGRHTDNAYIDHQIRSEKVTKLHFVPSMFATYLDYLDATNQEMPPTLKQIFCSGEALSMKQVEDFHRIKQRSQVTLHNLYGPTEASIDVTSFSCHQLSRKIPIGKPIQNTKVYILDEALNPVAMGVTGELYLSGVCLARGYLNKESLTTEKFIKNPFVPSERMYKTGDLARYLPDGNIEYLGRNDFQVKLNGLRIELEEIENSLSQFPGIKSSVVFLKKRVLATQEVVQYLVAYYVSEEPMNHDSLKLHLENNLPDYMVPHHFISMSQWPLTVNGKLDRGALPEPDFEAKTILYEKPSNELEHLLCQLWSEVLSVDTIGVHDDFFALGGDSILSIRIISKLSQRGYQLSVQDILQGKTIKKITDKIEKISEEETQGYRPFSLINPQFLQTRFSQAQVELEDVYPVSYLQLGMLLEAKRAVDGTYHDVFCYKIHSGFDYEHFLEQWVWLTTKHAALRTSFISDASLGYVALQHKKISRNAVKEKIIFQESHDLKDLIQHEKLEAFNEEVPGLFRVIITKQEQDSFVLVLSFHHAMADGWSIASLMAEFTAGYVGQANYQDMQTLPFYGQFIAKEKQILEDILQAEFWTHYLSDLDYEKRSFNFNAISNPHDALAQVNYILDEEASKKVLALAKRLNVLPDCVFISLYQQVLATFYNQEDILLGLVVNNRLEQFQGEEMVGLFLNTIPLRSRIQQQNKLDLIEAVAQEKIKLHAYKSYPYGQIKSDLNLQEDLYQCAFNYIHFHVLDRQQSEKHMSYAAGFGYAAGFEKTNIPLLLNVMRMSDNFYLQINAHTSFIDKETLQRWMTYLIHYLHQLIDDGCHAYSLPEEEYKKVVYTYNQTDKKISKKTIHQLFEDQVLKTPNDIALVFENTKMTYQVLNQKANQLARMIRETYYQIHKKELEPDTLIPLLVERGCDIVVGILGILKAGAAYVPLDEKFPQERIDYILKDCNSSLIVTQSTLAEQFKSSSDKTFILLDRDLDDNLENDNNLTSDCSTQLAYVMYTSGTTGKPKGVMIQHDSLVNTLAALNNVYSFKESGKKLGFFTSYVFDVSVSELFTALLNGGELHIFSHLCRQCPDILSEYINDHQLNYVYLPPVILSLLPKINYPTLQGIVFAGEPCDQKAGEYWLERIPLYNYYGPTEATIYATGKQAEKRNVNEIGRPIQNMRAYVLNKHQQPVPVSVVGELYLSGVGVARGYLNAPELTKEKFVTDRFQPTMLPMYRTGDLVRWLPDGNLEYLGRGDSQVKIRGFRIELAEVEHAVSTLKVLAHSCVCVREIQGEKELVCFYVSQDADLDDKYLRQPLRALLPEHMIPTHWVKLKKMPLTINGKIDQRQLQLPSTEKKIDLKTPLNELQQKVLEAWQLVLSRKNVDVDDLFFDVGGNSLKIIQLKHQLDTALGAVISVADLFKYPTIRSFCDSRIQHPLIKDDITSLPNKPIVESKEIAIIAMSGAFSGCSSVQDYWECIVEGREGLTFLDPVACQQQGVDVWRYQHPHYVSATGYVAGIEEFDANFWGLSPKEAAQLDPQIRKFVEHCWYALEDAGYAATRQQSSIALFAGTSQSRYLEEEVYAEEPAGETARWQSNSMKATQFLATRASYLLGLTGTSMNVNTACSTSLVAIIEACEKLALGSCQLALAGAVNLRLLKDHGHVYQEGMIFSKDGHCRPFDESASGTVNGSGVGVVLLKRLQDAERDGDNILAVIKGYATNNDGQRKVGYTAPSIVGQAECILMAQQQAGITADQISYMECHGTGTHLGDPIEIAAICDAFYANTNHREELHCTLGSVKANIGHTDSVAGIAGVIKVCNMLKHRILPPQINFKQLNKNIGLNQKQFKILTEKETWFAANQPLRAGVSSFGVGGTNAHLILEEYKNQRKGENLLGKESQENFFLPLSAKNDQSLLRYKDEMIRLLKAHKSYGLSNIAYTLQKKRTHFNVRHYVLAETERAAIEQLEQWGTPTVLAQRAENPTVVFMFPGQGSQYLGMGRALYETEPVFRKQVSDCFEKISQWMTVDLTDFFNPLQSSTVSFDIDDTQYAQPILFAMSYALAKQFEAYGIAATAYIGHSIGDYVAATLAGVFSLEDALKLVILRARLMHEMPEGRMLTIQKSAEFIQTRLPGTLDLAVINAPESCVVSGPRAELLAFQSMLEGEDIPSKLLHTSHGFHSRAMEKAATLFESYVAKVSLSAPQRPFISSMTGKFILEEEATSPAYWGQQIRKPVLFSQGIQTLAAEDEHIILLELGPANALASFVSQHKNQHPNLVAIPTLLSAKQATAFLKENKQDLSLTHALAKLWQQGYPVNLNIFSQNSSGMTIVLPNYSFEKNVYWLDKTQTPLIANFYKPVWQKISLCLTKQQEIKKQNWLIFMDNTGRLQEFADLLLKNGCAVTCVMHDEDATLPHIEQQRILMNTKDEEAYHLLFQHLQKEQKIPNKILHGLTLSTRDELHHQRLDNGFYSVLLLQRQVLTHLTQEVDLILITQGISQITGNEFLIPEHGTLLASLRGIPQEMPWVKTMCLDIGLNTVFPARSALSLFQDDQNFEQQPFYALRNNVLWQQSLALMTNTTQSLPKIQQDDVILISGGLGGMALSIAKEIAKHYTVTFILIGRTVIHEHHPAQSILTELRQTSCKVELACLDITDFAATDAFVKKIKTKYGRIHGVIHAAGVPPRGIMEQSMAEIPAILAPKIQGTQSLLNALQAEPLRYFAMMSSLTTWLGVIGTSAYSAANAYLDVLSASNDYPQIEQLLAINWPRWNDAGMGVALTQQLVSRDKNSMEYLNGVSNAEGAALFYQLLNQGVSGQCLVSKFDLAAFKETLFNHKNKIENFSQTRKHTLTDVSCSEIENNIAILFSDILGIHQFSKQDSFFDLGGSSLTAVQLVSQLKKQQLQVSISDLVIHSTVASLAQLVAKNKKISCMVPMKINQREKESVFFIHPVGGTLIMYRELLEQLQSQYNYYGIQNINLDHDQLIERKSLEDLASDYLKEIKKVQPVGPYILMGASLGGTIAYEIACQLIQQGDKVRFVAMFDSWAIFSKKNHDESIFKAYMEEQMLNEIETETEALRHIEDEETIQKILRARWQLMTLLLHYKPQNAPSSLSMHLFKASMLDQFHKEHGDLPDNGWQQQINKKIQSTLIAGDHISLLQRPGVQHIATALNLLLDAEKRQTTTLEHESIFMTH